MKNRAVKLRVDWATHEAAKFACEKWHYSKCLPIGKLVKIGAWEDDRFIGTIIFSYGTAKDLGTKYGLTSTSCVELTRVALTRHITPVSRVLAIALRFLKRQSPGIRLVVSFADAEKGHHGGIYQAGNWIYAGNVDAKYIIFHKGVEMPLRTYFEIYKTNRSIKSEVVFKPRKPKYRYLMRLDFETKDKISKLAKPYPKRASSVESGTSAYQAERGGESPTDALQLQSDTIE